MAKYSMSLVALGLAEELRQAGIARELAVAAHDDRYRDDRYRGGRQPPRWDAAIERARVPEIMADAAHAILVRDSRSCTGNVYLD